MKRLPYAALIAMLVLGGCAGPDFQPYPGKAVRMGTGGTVKMVKGMEVWTGTPRRKFEIVGTISDSGGGLLHTMDGEVVRIARAHGADALVVMEAHREITAVDPRDGSLYKRAYVTVAAIKYL